MLTIEKVKELRVRRNESVKITRDRFGMEPEHLWDDALDTLEAALLVVEAAKAYRVDSRKAGELAEALKPFQTEIVKRVKVCKHPDVWFDRSVEYCGPNCEDQNGGMMHDRCVKCGMSNCEMNREKRRSGERGA